MSESALLALVLVVSLGCAFGMGVALKILVWLCQNKQMTGKMIEGLKALYQGLAARITPRGQSVYLLDRSGPMPSGNNLLIVGRGAALEQKRRAKLRLCGADLDLDIDWGRGALVPVIVNDEGELVVDLQGHVSPL